MKRLFTFIAATPAPAPLTVEAPKSDIQQPTESIASKPDQPAQINEPSTSNPVQLSVPAKPEPIETPFKLSSAQFDDPPLSPETLSSPPLSPQQQEPPIPIKSSPVSTKVKL